MDLMERIGRHVIDIDAVVALNYRQKIVRQGGYGGVDSHTVDLHFFNKQAPVEFTVTDGELELLYELLEDDTDYTPDDDGGQPAPEPVPLPHTDVRYDPKSHHYVTDPERQAA